MKKCKRCGQVPECGPVSCELCRVDGCDCCVPQTDCGHDLCFDCIEKANKKAEQMLKDAGCIDADGRTVINVSRETQEDNRG